MAQSCWEQRQVSIALKIVMGKRQSYKKTSRVYSLSENIQTGVFCNHSFCTEVESVVNWKIHVCDSQWQFPHDVLESGLSADDHVGVYVMLWFSSHLTIDFHPLVTWANPNQIKKLRHSVSGLLVSLGHILSEVKKVTAIRVISATSTFNLESVQWPVAILSGNIFCWYMYCPEILCLFMCHKRNSVKKSFAIIWAFESTSVKTELNSKCFPLHFSSKKEDLFPSRQFGPSSSTSYTTDRRHVNGWMQNTESDTNQDMSKN